MCKEIRKLTCMLSLTLSYSSKYLRQFRLFFTLVVVFFGKPSDMTAYDRKINAAIGEKALGILKDAVSKTRLLDAKQMGVTAYGLGDSVGGSHKMRMEERVSADWFEFRRILADWYNNSLCEYEDDRCRALNVLIDTFDPDENPTDH